MANDLDFAALSAVLDGLLDAPAPPLDDLRPLLLERSPMRARLRDHHQSQVSRLDEALAQIRGAERKLAQFRNNLILRRRAFASTLSPILALPDEILERIFELVVFPPRIPWGRPSRAITVSHVCSRWRSVATSISRFWTDLSITSLAKSHLVSAFAERSGSLRLGLSFPYPNDNFPAFEVNLTSDLASRIRSLHFDAPGARHSLIFPDPDEKLLALDEISFRFNGELEMDDLVRHTLSLSLTRCTIHATQEPLYLSQLRTLSLASTTLLTIDHLLYNTMPRLHTLCLRDICDGDSDPEPPTDDWRETFSSLEYFELNGCSPVAWAWLAALHLPNLQHLAISSATGSAEPYEADELLQLFTNAACNITTLTISMPRQNILGFARMMATTWPNGWHCPSLTTLSIGRIAWGSSFDEADPEAEPGLISAHLPAILEQRLGRLGNSPLRRITKLSLAQSFVGEGAEQWYSSRVADFSVIDDDAVARSFRR